MFRTITASIAAVVLAGAAHAATETYDFTGYHSGTYYSSYDFASNSGDSHVTVSMGTYNGDDYISDGSDGGGYVGQWTGWGIGVCAQTKYGCDKEHYVDGYDGHGPNEYVKFSFGHNVVVDQITFLDYHYGNGYFEMTPAGGDDYTDLQYDLSGYHGVWNNDGEVMDDASMFFVGAYGAQGFKIKSITVSYDMSEVPLPAAGFLLLGGLGGLAALRRRKT